MIHVAQCERCDKTIGHDLNYVEIYKWDENSVSEYDFSEAGLCDDCIELFANLFKDFMDFIG